MNKIKEAAEKSRQEAKQAENLRKQLEQNEKQRERNNARTFNTYRGQVVRMLKQVKTELIKKIELGFGKLMKIYTAVIFFSLLVLLYV